MLFLPLEYQLSEFLEVNLAVAIDIGLVNNGLYFFLSHFMSEVMHHESELRDRYRAVPVLVE